MATRNILIEGEPALTKNCRPVTEFNERLGVLLDDLRETMTASFGAGLAAPQVGILRRVAVVLEMSDDEDLEGNIIELVNPEIIETEGECEGPEGCLSLPGVVGIVRRPERVRVRAFDRNGNVFETEGTGMTARAFCHEIDHLNGKIFTELADKILNEQELEEFYNAMEDAAGAEDGAE